MSSHTPGQWTQLGTSVYQDRQNTPIIRCYSASADEDFANARLIAAAPDLLAACIEALFWLYTSSPGEQACAKQLAAAIAKAEGKP